LHELLAEFETEDEEPGEEEHALTSSPAALRQSAMETEAEGRGNMAPL